MQKVSALSKELNSPSVPSPATTAWNIPKLADLLPIHTGLIPKSCCLQTSPLTAHFLLSWLSHQSPSLFFSPLEVSLLSPTIPSCWSVNIEQISQWKMNVCTWPFYWTKNSSSRRKISLLQPGSTPKIISSGSMNNLYILPHLSSSWGQTMSFQALIPFQDWGHPCLKKA